LEQISIDQRKKRSFSKKEGNEERKIGGFKKRVLSLWKVILSHFFAFGTTTNHSL